MNAYTISIAGWLFFATLSCRAVSTFQPPLSIAFPDDSSLAYYYHGILPSPSDTTFVFQIRSLTKCLLASVKLEYSTEIFALGVDVDGRMYAHAGNELDRAQNPVPIAANASGWYTLAFELDSSAEAMQGVVFSYGEQGIDASALTPLGTASPYWLGQRNGPTGVSISMTQSAGNELADFGMYPTRNLTRPSGMATQNLLFRVPFPEYVESGVYWANTTLASDAAQYSSGIQVVSHQTPPVGCIPRIDTFRLAYPNATCAPFQYQSSAAAARVNGWAEDAVVCLGTVFLSCVFMWNDARRGY